MKKTKSLDSRLRGNDEQEKALCSTAAARMARMQIRTQPPRGVTMQPYLWIKTAHLVFVMAWMGGVFYLPRILVNLAEAGDVPAVRERLLLMGSRLYRFGHIMFGLAVVFGLTLWLHFGIAGAWLHAKLVLVAVLLAHYIVAGRWLKGVARGRALPSSKALRWFNELPVLVLVAIVYLVLAKPF
jgi:putative membrane protein